MKKNHLLLGNLIFFIFILSSCQSTNSNNLSKNSIQVQLSFNPASESILGTIEICDMSIPDFDYVFYFTEQPSDNTYFHFGEPNKDLSSLIPITYDDFAILINPNNSTTSLSLSQIQSIFSGRIDTWQTLNNTSELIQVYIYAQDSEIQIAFKKYVMQNQSLSMNAEIVSSISEMREKISNNMNAIGFIPKSQSIQTDNSFVTNVFIPILVEKGTKTPYADDRVLACLQSETMQIILLQKYSAKIQ